MIGVEQEQASKKGYVGDRDLKIDTDRAPATQMISQIVELITRDLDAGVAPALILNSIRRHADLLEDEIRREAAKPPALADPDPFDGRDYNDPNRR